MLEELEELLAEQHDRGGQYRMINPPHQTPTLIGTEERRGLTCYKCGTKLSVKYKTTVDNREVCLCNRCITTI